MGGPRGLCSIVPALYHRAVSVSPSTECVKLYWCTVIWTCTNQYYIHIVCTYIVLAFPSVYNCIIVSMCRNSCSRAATDASLVGSSTPAGATTGQLQLVCMHKHEHCFVQFVCVNEHCFVQFVCVNDHCFVQFVWLCIWSTVCVCVCVRACVRTCVWN